MIDHNVMRLDISVHDAFTVAVVQRLEKLVYVVPHVVVLKLGVQAPKVGVVDILKDQRGCFALRCGALALLPTHDGGRDSVPSLQSSRSHH